MTGKRLNSRNADATRRRTHIRTSMSVDFQPPEGWEDMPARLANAEVTDRGEITSQVVPAIAETVRKQVEIGIDCINDGEFYTARSLAHYAAHFTGLEVRSVQPGEPPTTRHSTRERDEFRDFYADMDRLGTLFFVPGEKPMPPMTERVVARGPVKSKGPQAINREIDAFKAAIIRSGSKVEEAFIAVLAPGWLDHFIFNEYYKPTKSSCSPWPRPCAKNTARWFRGIRAADRRSRASRLVGHDQARADGRRLPQVRQAAHRSGQPRARRHSGGAGALSPLLGQLAWAAYPRPAAGAHHRSGAHGEGADLFLRGRQRAARARMARLAGGRRCRPARC